MAPLDASHDATPETVAKGFLAALDAERWLEAAQWLLRVQNASEADALSVAEIFARFAASLGPGAHSERDAPLRLRRVLLGVEQTAQGGTARYRTEVYTGNTPLHHFPWWNDERELRLVQTPEGWRIQDVNLGVTGDGHLLLSKTQMAMLRVGTWFGSWRPDGGEQGSRGEGPE